MSSWLKRTALAAAATVAFSSFAVAQVVYNRGNTGDPETLDTHKTSTVQESHILRDMLEGLVAYTPKQKPFQDRLRSGKSATTARPIALRYVVA